VLNFCTFSLLSGEGETSLFLDFYLKFWRMA